MKAVSKFVNAVSAAAICSSLAATGAVAVQLASISAAHAAVVRSIDVRGNQRVDDETIRGYVGIRPGQNFSAADIDEGVKRLFATGLFSDVRINQTGSTLVVQVDELSVVNQVIFQGNKKIKDANLSGAVQMKPRSNFSNAAMEADVEAVRAAYSRIGRDDATVSAQTIDLGENRVNVVYTINEGDRTKIKAINFEGNSAFSDRRLSDVISTKESNLFSFLTRNDIYDENRLNADAEVLRRFYYNRGYADFQVVSSNAALDEATNEYTISFVVEEGERYTFGDIQVETTIANLDSSSLQSVAKTRQGNVYSAKNVEDSIINITERLAGSGYAFAQVTPRGDRNFENKTISVLYSIDEGPRAYIERIEIRGNGRTRDYVIRREFDISEGDAFNQVMVQRAKRRLEALDFFNTVNISTAPGTQADQVVLVVDVNEKSTGEFSIGAGYTTGGETAGPSVEGSITERNFLGRGQFIRVAAGGGRNSRDYTLSFTEPYFLGYRVSAGFDVFRKSRDYDDYDSTQTGATVRLGLPITESLTGQLAYTYSQEEYNCDGWQVIGGINSCSRDDLSQAIIDGIAQSPWVRSSVSATLTYNTIDDMKNPHSGIFSTGTAEFAGLGGDAEYVKLTARGTAYHTLSEELDLVGLVSLGGGHIINTGSGNLRIFDMFKANDRIVRGFDYDGFGPFQQDPGKQGDHIGGTTYLSASAEVQFPLPVVPESFGLRGAAFADIGTLYGNDLADANGNPYATASRDMAWRASAGVGLMWNSPFGPLRVDYAHPLMKEDTDKTQEINFGISTRF